jgi:hypothetical protein
MSVKVAIGLCVALPYSLSSYMWMESHGSYLLYCVVATVGAMIFLMRDSLDRETLSFVDYRWSIVLNMFVALAFLSLQSIVSVSVGSILCGLSLLAAFNSLRACLPAAWQ